MPQSADAFTAALNGEHFAALVQYPCSTGLVEDLSGYAAQSHAQSAALIVASDLLALTLLKAPGEMGADIVVFLTIPAGSVDRDSSVVFTGPWAGVQIMAATAAAAAAAAPDVVMSTLFIPVLFFTILLGGTPTSKRSPCNKHVFVLTSALGLESS